MVVSKTLRDVSIMYSVVFCLTTVLLLFIGMPAEIASAAPVAPTGFTGAPGDGTAYLSWNKNKESNLDGYNVYCSTSSSSLGNKVNSSLIPKETPYFTHTGLTNGKTYYYRVKAVDTSNGESSSSSRVSVKPNKPSIVNVSGTISRSTTWRSNKIYIVTGNVTVNSGYTLYVKPGAIVKFNSGCTLIAKGKVNAKGMPNYRAIFTSYRDDEAGGDTNNDGAGSSPAPGDWPGFKPRPGSTVALNQAVIRYGDYGIMYYAPSSQRYNSSYFVRQLYAVDSEFSHNRNGIYILGIQYATVRTCDISDNTNFGMMIVHCLSSSIQYNDVTKNGTSGVNSKAVEIDPRSLPKFTGNYLSDNIQNAVWIWDAAKDPTSTPNPFSYTRANATLYSSTVYVLYGSTWVSANTTLTIQPGTVIKGQPGALVVQGVLSALGDSSNPIVFTSFLDSTYGGPTQGEVANPVPGDWHGLVFDPGGKGTIAGAMIMYARNAINASGANVSISDSCIIENKFGIGNTAGSPVINAENNWWGASDGPKPLGNGNAISDLVDADPWLTIAPF